MLGNETATLLHKQSAMIRTVHAALIDLSGTLHIEDLAITGAQEALEKLKNVGVKVKFVTNTTKEPLQLLHERLQKLGFHIEKNDIFTSLTAARKLVEHQKVRPLLLLEKSAKEDFKGINCEDPNAVVIGLSPSSFNYSHMNQAFRLLQQGASLIAIHKARYFKKTDGLYLGPGPFVNGLEYAADIKAEVVGKPQPSFFLEALKDLHIEAGKAVMIGDDAIDDVNGAMNVGMMGILVKTGKYRSGDENKPGTFPTAVCENFPSAVDYILKYMKYEKEI